MNHVSSEVANSHLLPHHLDDLQRSGLNENTISDLGFHSGTAEQVQTILGFASGPGLVSPAVVMSGTHCTGPGC